MTSDFGDILADLNEPQLRAVTHVDGPLLVLAGAGSGKTRVITRRVAYLIGQGVAPWHVLAITFTNKAAGEMRQRVESLGVPRGATVCTFHSLCVKLLREFAGEASLSSSFSIYDRADQIKLVKDAMARLEIPADRLPPAAVHSEISRAKNELKTAQVFASSAADFFSRQVAKVFLQYQSLLAAANAVDFDDLLLRVAFLFRDRPDIRRMLGQRYKYVLIDEYQDINRAQYLLAHGLAMEHENICATGDPDQSIYAWRGADINNILEFEKDYPNAVVVMLEENYRSTAPILNAASQLIAHNVRRKDKKLWTRRAGGANVRVLVCDDERAEARQVVRRIADLHSAGRDYSDMAVFYRVNSLSRVVEEALLGTGIPYRVARGVEFYNRKEVKDVLAYLRLLVNPSDDLSCQRVINTPARGIGAATVGRLSEAASAAGIAMLEACRSAAQHGLGAAAARKVADFAAMIDDMARLTGSAAHIMKEVVRRSGIGASLNESDEEDAQARANVDELISTAAEFDAANPGGSLAEYLHQVSLVSDVDHFEGAGGAVSLMTLHAAKGLEFPCVFVIGWEDGLLPFRRGDREDSRRLAGDPLEEERRLAFVGMTRAQDELTLSCARRRMLRGRSESQSASQFLGEIGRQQVAVEDVSGMDRSYQPVSQSRGGFHADADERAIIESMADAEGFPHEYEHLRPGCRVRHEKFGEGKLTGLRMPWPQTKADIFFDEYGPKTIVLRYTKLELLD